MSAQSQLDEHQMLPTLEVPVSAEGGRHVGAQKGQIRDLERSLQLLEVPVVTLPRGGGGAEYLYPPNWPSTQSDGHRPSLDPGANVGYGAVLNSRIAVVDVDTKNWSVPAKVDTRIKRRVRICL